MLDSAESALLTPASWQGNIAKMSGLGDIPLRPNLTYPPVPFNRTNGTYSNMSLTHSTGLEVSVPYEA